MFLPVVHYDDGYGFTYGSLVSFVDSLGRGSRVSMPFTWGGERQARVQVEHAFPRGRIAGDAGLGRRENPHYEIGDTRTGGHARAEGAVRTWLRVGGGGGVEDVRFGGLRERLQRGGVDVTLDTRVDPAFPRNAVHATVGWEHLSFDAGRANRTTTDVRAYVGVIRQTVLAVRGLSIASSDPVPVYEQSLLGGSSTLRGYDAGYKASDNIAAVSAELRMPITSPLSIGRFGVKVFADAGAAYAAGSRLSDQKLEAGYGAGVYMHLTIVRLSLDVARSDKGHARMHFGFGVTFR
jgi:outer membrane protein assembly factor BamA